jgi:hypothetical protein
MSVRFIHCLLYSCQIGRHVWVWAGNYLDKRLRCENCGVPHV